MVNSSPSSPPNESPLAASPSQEQMGLGHLENVAAGGSLDLAAGSREEASHVLQHVDLVDPQSSRRLR
jgi:hypothetical protein